MAETALFAGVGWSDRGYRVAGVDRTGSRRLSSEFDAGASGVADLIALLQGAADGADGGVACFIDSSSGLLAGALAAAGLAVHRVDPPLLGRPSGADPWTLASIGRDAVDRLPRIDAAGGLLSGRQGDQDAALGGCAGIERERAAAGRFLPRRERPGGGVALTFDDGPHPPYTEQVLDVLRDFGVPATFFCVGLLAGVHPQIVARAQAEGSSVGNHTWSHPFLPDLDDDGLAYQVRATAAALAAATGRTPTLFRPPYGARSPDSWRVLDDLGQVVVCWDVAAADWLQPGVEAIVDAVLGDVRDGSIVLLHDGGGDRSQTVAALPAIIEGLLARGHRLVTVEELAAFRP